MPELVSTSSPCEPELGVSRAVRAGPIVTVSGTALPQVAVPGYGLFHLGLDPE